MAGNDGWGSSIWKQMQQVKVTREGGIQAPVRANGKDGIQVGNPPLDPIGRQPSRPGLLTRLKLLIARG